MTQLSLYGSYLVKSKNNLTVHCSEFSFVRGVSLWSVSLCFALWKMEPEFPQISLQPPVHSHHLFKHLLGPTGE